MYFWIMRTTGATTYNLPGTKVVTDEAKSSAKVPLIENVTDAWIALYSGYVSHLNSISAYTSVPHPSHFGTVYFDMAASS